MKQLITLLALLAVSVISGQNFLITNVTVFDGEKLHTNTSVLVEDGKVKGVSPHIESDAEEIDGTGKFLMPAMTNSHVHAWGPDSLTEAASAGVINMLDMHGMEQFQPQLQSFKDSTNYARYYFAGYAATAPDGHGTQFGFPVPTVDKPEDAAGFVADRLKAGASYIKIIEEPWKPTLSHGIVKALVEEAHKQGTIAVVHISKVDDAYQVLSNNANGLVHIWWDKPIDDSRLKELSMKNFFVIPTVLTSHLALKSIRPRAPEQEFLSDEAISDEVRKLYEAGVPILAGTDPPNAGINYGTDLHKEMNLLSQAGMSNIDVLKSATSNPATFFSLENTGFIRSGYYADMVLLDESPIDDMTNMNSINTVWKEGKVVGSQK